MSIKLGNTTINKIYLGNTEIKKVYLGNTIIYDKTGSSLPNIPTNILAVYEYVQTIETPTGINLIEL